MRHLRLSFYNRAKVHTTLSQNDTPSLSGSHVPALDGLRGIAILLVMLFHFTFYGGMHPVNIVDRTFYNLATSGWMGVDLFFVLSGFLITGILYDTKKSAYFFRNFYARRFVRIFPLYYGTLFFFFIVLPRLGPLSKELQFLVEQQGWYWSYLINIRIALHDWSPFGIIEHFWSLAVEEQFYLFWPIFVFLLSKRKLIIICLVFIITSLIVRVALVFIGYPTATNVLTFARMDALAVGALLAMVARSATKFSSLSPWAWPIVAMTIISLLTIAVWRHGFNADDLIVQTIGYTFLALLFGATLTLALTQAPESPLGRVFAAPILQFFGRYSYALYIFHHPILFYLKDHIVSVETLPRLMGLQLPAQIIFIIIATSISLVFALVSWYLYEQPILKLKRLFPYEYETKTSSKFEMPVGRSITP